VTSKKNLLLVLPAALILSGAVFLAVRPRSPRAVEVGESAPRFDLPTLAEGSASLGDFHGQVVVLNFWATWCAPCVEETPSLEKFAEQMRPDGVAVIGVSVDQDQAALVLPYCARPGAGPVRPLWYLHIS
jgi:thiol-disulfide isomerase/thioredoxin